MAFALLSSDGGVLPDPGAKVLKADEYRAFLDAGELVREAGRKADAMRAATEEECVELRRKAVRDGLEEGKAEIAMQMLETVTASVEQLATMESSLVDVVMRSLRVILGKFDREELVVQVVGHALRLVRDEKRILLRVSSDDYDTVQRRISDIVSRYPGMGRVDVSADATLSPGGCVLETDIGVIDATLERQLTLIEENFRRHIEENAGK